MTNDSTKVTSRFEALIEKFTSIKEKYGDEYPIIFYEPTIELREFVKESKTIEFFAHQEEAFKFAQGLGISFILIAPNNEQELVQRLQNIENVYHHRMCDFEEELLLKNIFDDKIEEKTRKSLKAYVFITLLDFMIERPAKKDEEEVMVMCGLKEIVKEFRQELIVIWYDPNASTESKEKLEKNIEVDIQEINIYKNFGKLLKRIESYSGSPYHLIISWNDEAEEVVKKIDNLTDILGLYIYDDNKRKIQAINGKIDVGKNLEELVPMIREGIRTRSKLTNTFPAFATNFDAIDKSHIYNVHYYLKGLMNFQNRKQAKDDFLKLALKIYQDNEKKLVKFDTEYDEFHHEKILHWYTKDSPVYKLVNNCLRISSSDSILYCRFILKDMERAIREEYQKKSKDFNGLVYRGAYISAEEWEKLQRNIGEEIEMYGFLSTSVNQRSAANFLKGDMKNKIFITIIVPPLPELDEQGFADLSQISAFKGEQEILFNVRSRFRILEAGVSKIDNRGTKGRHLILLYGAQALTRYMTKHQPVIEMEFSKEEMRCDLCGSREKLFGFNQTEVQCFDCLVKNEVPKNTPLVVLDPLENKVKKSFGGRFLSSHQMSESFPYYGYKCCDCQQFGKSKYYKWVNADDQEISEQCSDCFIANKRRIEPNTILINEENPYTFWREYQAEWETVDSNYQVKLSEEVSCKDQGDVFMEVQRYDLCIEYGKKVFEKWKRKRFREMEKLKIFDKTGRAYEKLGECQQALNYLKVALDFRKAFYGENHPHTAGSYHNLASVYERLGAHLQALDYFTKALDIKRVLYVEMNHQNIESYNNLASVYHSLGYHQQALKYHGKALDLSKLVHGKKHPQTAGAYHNLASIYQSLGDEKKALEYYQRALHIRKAIYGEKHPDVATTLNNIASIYERLKTPKEALECYQKAVEIQVPIYGEKHPNIASSYNNIALVYHSLGEHKEATNYLEKALAIRKLVYGEKHSHIATTYNNFGLVYNSLGDHKKALEYYQEALDILISTYGEKHPNIAATYSGLASVHESLGEIQYTLMYFTKALDLMRSNYGEKHPEVAISYNNLAAFYEKLGRHKEALEYHKKSLEITKALYGEKHPSTATSYNNLGLLYQNLGDYQQAIVNFSRAFELLKGIHGEKHPRIATLYNNMAMVYERMGDHEKALEGFLKAVDLNKEIYGEKHQETAGVYNNLATVYLALRDFGHAKKYFTKALEIKKAIENDEKHPEIATAYNNLASVLNNLGEYQQALEYVMKALDIRKAVYGEKHPSTATSYNNLASLLDKMGDYQQALVYNMKSLDITKEIYGEKHPNVAITYNNIASVYEGLGDYKKALEYRKKALEIQKAVYGENHPRVIGAYKNISMLYKSLGEDELAFEFHKKAAATLIM